MTFDDRLPSSPVLERLSFLPIVVSLFYFTVLFICLAVFLLERRFTWYFPTISETAVGFPNHAFFSFGMTFSASFLALVLSSYVSALDCCGMVSKKVSVTSGILSWVCPVMCVGVACANLQDSFAAHMTFAVLFFASVLVAFCVLFIGTWDHMFGGIFKLRFAAIVVLTVSTIGLIITAGFIKSCVATTISAVSEWTFAIALLLYLLSFMKELGSVRCDVVLTEEVEGAAR
jgi:hypothetical protein